MSNIHVLDCTLRDGGRLFNCAFTDECISSMTKRFTDAKIDIVEIGFLRDWRKVEYKGNSTFFTDVDQIRPFISKPSKTKYVAFVDYGMFDFDTLKPCDGTSIDGIRVGFTKKDFNNSLDDVIRALNIVKERGYMLFIQGVNTLGYTDKQVLEIVDFINQIHPFGFGIVDTYGAMYVDDVYRIYTMVDHNLTEDIYIDFHSHNNYQLSFALAQEVVKLSRSKRNIIIDATLSGIGKVAGNLNTELIVDYLVRKCNCNYEVDDIFDMIDDFVEPYKKKYSWGYSIPAMMAGIYQSHPNNVLYLTDKFRLQTKDIRQLLSMITPEKRQRYDYDNIDNLYSEYVGIKINDTRALSVIRNMFEGKNVLVLVPGNSINQYKEKIEKHINTYKPVVISVNHVSKYSNIAFFGNAKRYANEKREKLNCIVTSNITPDNDNDLLVNYYSLIDKHYKYYDNSTLMLINLLNKIGIINIVFAGFDGFSAEKEDNYINEKFQNERNIENFDELNRELADMLRNFIEKNGSKSSITHITPSKFSNIV